MSRNRLGETASPYLRQHADNPVHWWPWTAAAFEEARSRNVPVHLSIGYAACHWCHVMADESFSNPDIAAYLNDHFINIKVDREERPDVDQIYMKALHALGEQGGWPLTMFLSPRGEPFWGGTYFPPESRWGRPGFRQLLQAISAAWQSGEKRITDNMTALVNYLGILPQAGTVLPDREMLSQAARNILSFWDDEKGGLRAAPKFPMSPLLDLLWRSSLNTGDTAGTNAVLTTLRMMSSGGIYDHLAGGFARYSVDAEWLVPHFEKMLSDNGQILSLLVRAWQATGEQVFRQRAEETASWIITDMQLPDGGFAASLDADTEHEEGLTYVWQKSEIDAVLGPDSERFCAVYDVQSGGNWEGKTILNRLKYDHVNAFDTTAERDLGKLRNRLLVARRSRRQPGRDEKVLADWNAMVITGLVEAAVAFNNPNYLAAARTAYRFVGESMMSGDQRAHTWCEGRKTSDVLATDLAQMTRAAIALHAATGEPKFIDHAEIWFSALSENYIDSENVFLTPADCGLIIRPSAMQDDATPSAAGIAVQAAVHLFLLTAKSEYLETAEAVLTAQSGQMSRDPIGSASLLSGFDAYCRPRLAFLAGEPGETRTALRAAILSEADPSMLMLIDHPDDEHAPQQALKTPGGSGPRIYLCEAASCRWPISDPHDAKIALQESRSSLRRSGND